MEPLNLPLSFAHLRQAKKYTEHALKELGIELSSSTTGNLVANMFGYKNWNTAKSLTEKASIQKEQVINKPDVSMNKLEESPLFNEIAGEYESYGFSEKDADELALFSVQHGIKEALPIDNAPLSEGLACLAHHWVCEVLNFLDEDKKSSKTKYFEEQMDIFSTGLSYDSTMIKYLKALETKENDIDIFKPFLRQLGLGVKDVKVAIECYNENMKNS
ncbi:MAG: hypothetical protein EOM50_18385 [Erysipelotrichia bacterium]|nr:hypothetical protein [Erysipelotrichia bacterium]